jgi:hypothetical protein
MKLRKLPFYLVLLLVISVSLFLYINLDVSVSEGIGDDQCTDVLQDVANKITHVVAGTTNHQKLLDGLNQLNGEINTLIGSCPSYGNCQDQIRMVLDQTMNLVQTASNPPDLVLKLHKLTHKIHGFKPTADGPSFTAYMNSNATGGEEDAADCKGNAEALQQAIDYEQGEIDRLRNEMDGRIRGARGDPEVFTHLEDTNNQLKSHIQARNRYKDQRRGLAC